MVSIGKNISLKAANIKVKETIKNGKAKNKFYEWIKYQKGDLSKFNIIAKKYIVTSDKKGYLNEIDANNLGKLVFDLGAGRKKKTDKIDYNVGFVINKALGSKINIGDILGVIYYKKEVADMENRVRESFIINRNKKRIHNIIIKVVK